MQNLHQIPIDHYVESKREILLPGANTGGRVEYSMPCEQVLAYNDATKQSDEIGG